jgi:hypothetical protein
MIFEIEFKIKWDDNNDKYSDVEPLDNLCIFSDTKTCRYLYNWTCVQR